MTDTATERAREDERRLVKIIYQNECAPTAPPGHSDIVFLLRLLSAAEAGAIKRAQSATKAAEDVASEIVEIMQTYDQQQAEHIYGGTPGGLEHMGDVWRLLDEWRNRLLASPSAMAERTGAESASPWREIASAPRDGTRILVVCGDRNLVERHVTIAIAADAEGNFENATGHLLVDPTHWQPLPSPPASEGTP